MKRFAELLRTCQEDLIARWERAVLEDPALPQANYIAQSALRDHIPELLSELAQMLEGHEHSRDLGFGREFGSRALHADHAADRTALGYTISAVVRELSHLRTVLVDFWWEHPGLDSRGVRVMHAALDGCMTTAAEHMQAHSNAVLRRERDRLDNVLKLLPVGVYISDASGGEVASNAAFHAIWGESRRKLSSWEEYGHYVAFEPSTGKQLEAQDWGLARALRTGESIRQELEIRSFDGQRKMVINSAAALCDATTQAVIGGVAVVVDATEMLTALRRLEEESELRDIFIGILGHDLRNPLGAIKLRSEKLLRGVLDEGSSGYARRILKAAEQMDRMISELLDFTRARLASIPIQGSPGDLWELCEEVVDDARQAHPRRKISFAAVGDGHGIWDRDRLAQVLGNLVSNALFYSAPGTDVNVTAETFEAGVRIEVHNLGPPIPHEVLPHIFEPFRRASQSASNRAGLGLGLFIATKIVGAHGGSIAVTSTAEEGTTFSVLLPRAPPKPPEPIPVQDVTRRSLRAQS